MTSRHTQRPMIIQDENLRIHHKIDDKANSVTTASKKTIGKFGSRKPLNDITNKSSVHQEVSSRKKNLPKEEFNIAEEKFLHDHKMCIEAQKMELKPYFLDIVLPRHDFVLPTEPKQAKTDLDSSCCYPEPVEIPMSGFSDWLKSSRWDSPPSSPIHWDSLPASPFAWQIEPVEFALKDEREGS